LRLPVGEWMQIDREYTECCVLPVMATTDDVHLCIMYCVQNVPLYYCLIANASSSYNFQTESPTGSPEQNVIFHTITATSICGTKLACINLIVVPCIFCRITSILQPTNAHIISHKTLLKHFKTLRHISILSDHHQGA